MANKLFYNARSNFIFHQDNDAMDTSRAVMNFVASTVINDKNWPSQSPDLNPIEYFWYLLKRRLGEKLKLPNSIHELIERVDVRWRSIHDISSQSLDESMPSKALAVKKAKGAHTGY